MVSMILINRNYFLAGGSEIATARVSSSYRKSMKRTVLQKKQQAGSTRDMSLSKISEEDIDEHEVKVVNKMNDCHATFVSDVETVTSVASNSSIDNHGVVSYN